MFGGGDRDEESAFNAQLPHDVDHGVGHRPGAETEPLGDLLIRQPFGHQRGDLSLASIELRSGARGAAPITTTGILGERLRTIRRIHERPHHAPGGLQKLQVRGRELIRGSRGSIEDPEDLVPHLHPTEHAAPALQGCGYVQALIGRRISVPGAAAAAIPEYPDGQASSPERQAVETQPAFPATHAGMRRSDGDEARGRSVIQEDIQRISAPRPRR